MLEAALMIPLLVLLAAGVFEFGRLMYQHQLIETGVRDAARFLSRQRTPATSETAAIELAVMGRVGGTTRRVSWWAPGTVTVTYGTLANPINTATGERTYRGPDPLRTVRVSTTVTYPGFGMLVAISRSSGVAVGFSHQERIIGE